VSSVQTWVYDWCDRSRGDHASKVAAELDVALGLDDNDSDVIDSRRAEPDAQDHDKAAYHQERALALNPNYDIVVVQQGEFLTCWDGLRKASTGSRRRCVSTRTTRSVSGTISGALATVPKNTPTRLKPSRGSRAPDHTHHAFSRDVRADGPTRSRLLRTPRRFSSASRNLGGNLPCDPSTTSATLTDSAMRMASSRLACRCRAITP